VAAGALIVTEAGGLVGNFTGEADYLHQREVVAGSPKIYGQLVTMLAPFTHVIKAGDAAKGAEAAAAPADDALTPEAALAAAATAPEAPKKKAAVRIRKADAAPF
jgi:myo-inositol-1(or 4)-monophosphatase